jgi:hypothetical protein
MLHHKNISLIPLLRSITLISLCITAVNAGTLVVDADGSGDHTTIQAAADAAGPGDTVLVRDGTYTDDASSPDNVVVRINSGGTADAWITIRSQNPEGAIIDGQDNTTGYGFSFGNNVGYVCIEGFEITGLESHGIMINSSGDHHITCRRNRIHHIGNIETETQYGIDGCFDNDACSFITYEANVFHNIGRTGPATVNFTLDHGIYTCGDNNTVVNNIFYDCNAGWGVQVAGYETVDNLVISNNVFAYGYKRGHIILWLPCSNITIQNNIFFEPAVSASINFLSDDLQDITIRNNLYFGGELKDNDDNGVSVLNDNLESDPLFMDPENGDFHILEGSPAIDAGIADNAPENDILGNIRPEGSGIDIGVFEYIPPETALKFRNSSLKQPIGNIMHIGSIADLSTGNEFQFKVRNVLGRTPAGMVNLNRNRFRAVILLSAENP